MNMDRNKIITISISVVVVLGIVTGYFYWRNRSSTESVSDIQSAADAASGVTENATQGVLPSIGEAANPLTNKPDINPTSKTNPFDSVKTNPFQSHYEKQSFVRKRSGLW